MDTDKLLAQRIRSLRAARGHTLEQLAELSGVSRSTISLIERAETSATAVVLNKLAVALDVPMAELFSEPEAGQPALPIAHRAEQPVWKDPASGYERRHVSPGGGASPIDLVEISFPAGQSVVFENLQRSVRTHQLVWMLDGEMEITVQDQAWRLRAGDCLAMVLDERLVFRNPTRKAARYAVALTSAPVPLRKL